MGKLAAHHSLHGKAGPHVKISVSLATSRGVLATREGQQGELEVKKGLIKTWQITGVTFIDWHLAVCECLPRRRGSATRNLRPRSRRRESV